MTTKKRQLTIKATLKRKAALTEPDEECERLEKEIEELREQLANKQAEFFQLKTETLQAANDAKPPKLNTDNKPEKGVHAARLQDLEEQCWRQKLVLGLDVAEYEDSHFTVLYNTQQEAAQATEYGLRIKVEDDVPAITKYSLPIGFNLSAAVARYDSIKHTEALCAVWRALVAFHARRSYYQALTKLLPYDVRAFAVLDTSHVELRLAVRADCQPERVARVVVYLDYDVSAVHAKTVDLRAADLSEEEEYSLRKQCAVFTKRPLDEAFSACFLERRGVWHCHTAYSEVEEDLYSPPQAVAHRDKPGRKRPAPPRPHDDESWLPEDIDFRRGRKRI